MAREMVRDAFGELIEIGAHVIYNQSGELAQGIVRELKPRVKYGSPYIEFLIDEVRGTQVVGKSVVKNNRCIVVLKYIEVVR